MLFISRMVNESLIIGDDIEIKVTMLEKDLVCLGIQAPRNLAISRKESRQQIKNIVSKSYMHRV